MIIDNKKINIMSEREYIYILKGFATISIVSAHCAKVGNQTNNLNILFSWILNQVGSIGVGIFFLISGYLFYKDNNTFINFFKKKIRTIFIPWIVTGTLVYIYIYLRKYSLEISTWIKFLLGDGSYLYYLTLLMIFYIGFFYKKDNINILKGIIFIFTISIIITANGILDGINPYLNPFNFIGYFSIGLLISKKYSLLEIGYKLNKYKFLLLVLYIAGLSIVRVLKISTGYWGHSTLVIQPIAILLIFSLQNSKFKLNKGLIYIGRNSFAIYLLHMPFAGIIANIFTRLNLWIITLLRPLIVIMITIIFIKLCNIIDKIFRLNDYLNISLGIKR